jgi:hypothetical protein
MKQVVQGDWVEKTWKDFDGKHQENYSTSSNNKV